MPEYRARDVALATVARALGARYALRIIIECRKTHGLVPVSLGLAVCEQESGFRNVWGHDHRSDGAPSGIPGRLMGQPVTEHDYRIYKRTRETHGNQGVGPMQLTSPGYQNPADRLGGCWVPRHNIAVAIAGLAGNIQHRGRHDGVAAYNAGDGGRHSQLGQQYASQVTHRYNRWHRRLLHAA